MAETAADLYHQLSALLNAHSVENASDTPDFILSRFMLDCLEAFERAHRDREQFYGRGLPHVDIGDEKGA